MKRSEQTGDLFAALAAAQAEFLPVVKNQRANYGMFGNLGAIIDATSVALSKHGLCVIQSGDYIDGRVITTTILGHKTGQWIETTISLKPKGDSEQAVGSAITYGRRYALAPLLGVFADVDDDAGHAVKIESSDKPNSQKSSNDSIINIFDKSDDQNLERLTNLLLVRKIDLSHLTDIANELNGKILSKESILEAISKVTG